LNFFRRYRTPLIILFFLLTVLVLVSISARRPESSRRLERGVLEVLGPVQRGGMAVVRFFNTLWDRYFNLVGVQRENELLRKRIDKLQARQRVWRRAVLENERLRRQLGLRRRIGLPSIAAEVIARDSSTWFKSIIINKGRRDGLDLNLPVLDAQGELGSVIGRVINLSPHFAKVLLLIDRHSAIDVIIQRSGTRGLVVGTGANLLRLKYVTRNADILPGDVVIASGSAGVFPKGTLVGRVKSVRRDSTGVFREWEVIPAVDFSRLDEVTIVRRPTPEFKVAPAPKRRIIRRRGR
jgi:rod shape-determining protein MreC